MKAIGTLLFLALVVMLATPVGAARDLDVDCTARRGLNTLAAAVEKARPGDTINVTGPCANTAVTITTDDLTIVGVENAILEGVSLDEEVIDINGARRVVIEGVTVRSGEDGILVRRGATVDLNNVVAEGNSDDGFAVVANAFARIRDCTAQDNGDDGFVVAFTSSAIISGDITSTGNGSDGISIVFGSSAELIGATVSITNNGLSDTFGSAMVGEMFTGDGIEITDASMLLVVISTVTITGNADDGIAVDRSSAFTSFANATQVVMTIEGNGDLSATVGPGGDGVDVQGASSFSTTGSSLTLNIQDNARRAFNVDDSAVNLSEATVNCSERPQDPLADSTCPTR